MGGWDQGGGFSVDAAVCIAGPTGQGWNACCVIAHARPSPWHISRNTLLSICSTTAPRARTGPFRADYSSLR